MGVWIETRLRLPGFDVPGVTPFVGVWIETVVREDSSSRISVTPFVGVWIETSPLLFRHSCLRSHTLRGCVD